MAVAILVAAGSGDRLGADRPKAFVELKSGQEVSEEDIIAFCKEHLAKFKCPTTVDWVDVLPRNPSGKILKKELRAPFWEGRERNVN